MAFLVKRCMYVKYQNSSPFWLCILYFACWRPEGIKFDEETTSILGGLLPRALKFKEYVLESKQHSQLPLYFSKSTQPKGLVL